MSEATLNSLVLAGATIFGAVATAFSVAFVIWTYNDMKARSRDPLAQMAAAILVGVLNIFGLIIYIMLRPRETLADAYERSLEEEALLQEIEEKPACPGCGRPTKHHWQVCPYCHTKLKKACVACDAMLDLSWNICPECATPQVVDEEHEVLAVREQGRRAAPRASVASQLRQSSAPPYDVSDYASSSPVHREDVEWVDSDY
jgi:RNA polymerase subunit RPABC4/transcription elongation factor Spt4